jgi:NADH:ubiquinone oxidoreductase subunit F (NADH-binding)
VQAAYSVLPQTPPPTFSPGAGTYAPGQTVTLADSISTATIRYTTDGSTPTTKSPVYSKPIPLSGTETIQAIAIAIAQGEAASNPVSATYTPQ